MSTQGKLKDYFPLIRERTTILEDIKGNDTLSTIFDSWNEDARTEFLDICSGVKGVKILYDSFFKEILNPEYAPERLNELLSLLLKQEVSILSVIPNDSSRIAAESSLLIMDILVQLEDGSLANLEVQKIGYGFPGQRAACYSSDLLLRQFKKVRSQRNRTDFSYKDIKPVYTIIFLEKSSKIFHVFKDKYKHRFEQKSDTGIELELLQKYIFIPLDIFKQTMHNKRIKNKSDAWLTFLSSDEPDRIIELIKTYPEFKAMYDNIYELCLNTERVMNMFSKELMQLDKNTVTYMIDEMQNELDEARQANHEKDEAIYEKNKTIHEKNKVIDEKNEIIKEKDEIIRQLQSQLGLN